MPSFYQWQGEALLIKLLIQPKAKHDEIVGRHGSDGGSDERLKIRITASPVDNKANKHLIKFLAKTFTVATSQITIISGENQRLKRVKIISPRQLFPIISKNKE